jgi:hypothetical protein
MLNPKKEASQVLDNTITIAQCPMCEALSMHVFYMDNSESHQKSKWHSCRCGVLWQEKYEAYEYGSEYEKKLPSGRKWEDSCKYVNYLLCPIIEESMYGRKVLMVGKNAPQAQEFADRGWIAYTIDKSSTLETSERLIAADFETFNFPDDFKVNLIWFYHTLESMVDVKAALVKAKSLLCEDGIIMIGTPDSDFLFTRGPAGFRHWKRDFNHILLNKSALVSHLEPLGFEVLLTKRNHDMRLPYQDDLLVVAQLKFY